MVAPRWIDCKDFMFQTGRNISLRVFILKLKLNNEPNINPGEIDCWIVPFWWPSLTVWVARQNQQSSFFLKKLGREPPASGMAEFCQLEDDTAAKTPVSTAENQDALVYYIYIYRCLLDLSSRGAAHCRTIHSQVLCVWCLKLQSLGTS